VTALPESDLPEVTQAADMPDPCDLCKSDAPDLSERAQEKHRVLNRLKRAQGQLNAAIAAFESDTECRAVVTQLAAVSSAVDRAGFAIVACNMKRCLDGTDEDPADHPKPTIEELEKLFMMLS